mgnify:CR=1 FL=1
MVEKDKYSQKLELMSKEDETLCRKCGCCCGALTEDRCSELDKLSDGTYFCKVYDHRLGVQKTVLGKSFTCVPIRQLRKYNKLYPLCPYL